MNNASSTLALPAKAGVSSRALGSREAARCGRMFVTLSFAPC